MRTPLVSDAVRVLLLEMHEDMSEAGQVRMSRAAYAARLGRAERRISDRLEQAVAAGLLDRVEKGAPGRFPLYAALLSPATGERVRAKGSRAWTDRGTDGGPTYAGRSAAPVDRRTGVPRSSRSGGARAPGGRVSRISNHPLTAPRLVAVPERQQEQRNDEDRQPAYHPATPDWPAVRRAGGGA